MFTYRVVEGIFRSLNNLLEEFHQSFFFYLLPESHRYVSIGLYMPPFGCLLLGPVIMAIVQWTLAGTGPEHEAKGEASQMGGVTGREGGKKESGEESIGQRSGPSETQTIDLEDKVSLALFKRKSSFSHQLRHVNSLFAYLKENLVPHQLIIFI